MQIAIVGSGLAAITSARSLQLQGHQVVLYEKADQVGGRMSTHETELGGFDHGAQYFTVRTDPFAQVVAAWRKAGWIAQWRARLVSLDQGEVHEAGDTRQRMVATPGMGALCEQLAQGLDVRVGQRITALERWHGRWLLSVKSDALAVAATAGPYDAVVLALPASHAASLLALAPAFAAQARQAQTLPCWSLMLAFEQSLGLDYQGAWVRGSRLGWIAHDGSKPRRRPGEHWVAHATPAWSLEHFEDDPERAKAKLQKAFHEATGTKIQPVYAAVHLWRSAQSINPVAGTSLWDPALRLGVCGDWFACGLEGNGKVENAWLSGTGLAAAMQ